MELSLEKIKTMEAEDIFMELSPMLSDIYASYNDCITSEEYKLIVLKIITLSKKVYKDDISYSEFISDLIKSNIAKTIKSHICDSSKSFLLVNRFIDNITSSSLNVDNALKVFKELDKLFKKNKFIPTIDFLIELLIKSDRLNSITKIVFNYYKYQVISGTIQDIFSNETLIATLNAYCTLNNIDIKEDESIDELASLDLKSPLAIYIDEVAKYPVLTIEQERELATLISQGDESARKKFIECNLKLVINIAKRYRNENFTLQDLIQEGNVGLISAVDKFDVNKGYKFSSYAIWWIRQAINRAIADKGKNIRVPAHLYERLSLYNKVQENLKDKLNREPTINELANEMGLSRSKINELINIRDSELSLNNPVGDSGSSEFSGSVPIETEPLEDSIINSFLKSDVKELFEKCNLTPKEIDILRMRFGFDDKKPASLDEIGQKYKLTRERIRQIIARAMKKIRYSKYIKEYSVYMQYPDKAVENIEKLRKEYSNDLNTSKGFFPSKEKTKKRKKLETKETKSIYVYFSDYTYEQINEMLSKLTDEDKALLRVRYGDDLLNPVINSLTEEEKKLLYGNLIPKMRMILNSLYKEHKEQNVMLEGTTIINRKRHTSSMHSSQNENKSKVLTLTHNSK